MRRSRSGDAGREALHGIDLALEADLAGVGGEELTGGGVDAALHEEGAAEGELEAAAAAGAGDVGVAATDGAEMGADALELAQALVVVVAGLSLGLQAEGRQTLGGEGRAIGDGLAGLGGAAVLIERSHWPLGMLEYDLFLQVGAGGQSRRPRRWCSSSRWCSSLRRRRWWCSWRCCRLVPVVVASLLHEAKAIARGRRGSGRRANAELPWLERTTHASTKRRRSEADPPPPPGVGGKAGSRQ